MIPCVGWLASGAWDYASGTTTSQSCDISVLAPHAHGSPWGVGEILGSTFDLGVSNTAASHYPVLSLPPGWGWSTSQHLPLALSLGGTSSVEVGHKSCPQLMVSSQDWGPGDIQVIIGILRVFCTGIPCSLAQGVSCFKESFLEASLHRQAVQVL